MKHFSRLFLYLLTPLLISACGFSPVYSKSNHADYQNNADIGAQDHLALTAISNIPDREGQFLRNRLIDRFHRNGTPQNPAYELIVAPVEESLIDLDITKTADSTRGQLRLTTNIILKDHITGKTLFTRALRSTTSYNILASEFSTRVSEQSARNNTLADLASQIETQLALYFNRQD